MHLRTLAIVVLASTFSSSLPAKDLVILMDGTWNNSIDYGGQGRGIKPIFHSAPPLLITDKSQLITPLPPQATNIARMFLLLENQADQKVVYIRGIGTDERESFRGGAFGRGAEERIDAALKFIETHWQAGDEICIFGFSRGAAMARQLAKRPELFGKTIRFMGLFDTVAAFGIPETSFGESDGLRKQFEDFHDKLRIPETVRRVVHLVALDENRLTFLPTLISQREVNTDRRKEIWFGGNHGDVGGGWDDETDAVFKRRQVTLRFMLEQNHGLVLRDGWQRHEDVKVDPTGRDFGKRHGDSYGFLEGYGGRQKREHLRDPHNPNFAVPYRPPLSSPVVHSSARSER